MSKCCCIVTVVILHSRSYIQLIKDNETVEKKNYPPDIARQGFETRC